jgi:hypothetical protein
MEDLETDGLTEKRAKVRELNVEFTTEEVRGVIEGMKKQTATCDVGRDLLLVC